MLFIDLLCALHQLGVFGRESFKLRGQLISAFLDEYDDVKVEAVDATTLRTPAEWNTVCREVILRNYDLMRPHTQLLFFERFEDWFNA